MDTNNVSSDVANKETLIHVDSKIVTSGSIAFLRHENGYYQKTIYSYRLDMKNHTPHCTFRESKLYKVDDMDVIRKSWWMTSSAFQQSKSYAPYFRCFSEDFLELSNDEKIKVLNEICNHLKFRKC